MQQNGAGGRVVVGVDGLACALQAVRWAAAEAVQRRLPLRLVSVYTWPAGRLVADPGLGVDPRRILRDAAREQLATAARAAAAAAPGLEVEQVTVEGFAVPVLQRESAEATLVVLGDRGLGGFTGLLIGSVAVALAAHSACPIVVVRGRGPDAMAPRTAPVVVGVDGSPTGDAVVAFAFEAAALWGVPLVAVHTWHDHLIDPRMAVLIDLDAIAAQEREVLGERLTGWSEKYPDVSVRPLVVHERAAHALVQESSDAQLLVVGSRGRGGLAGMLHGSVSQAVLHHAHCPVAVVRPPTIVEEVERR